MFANQHAVKTDNAFQPRLEHKRAQTSWRPNRRPKKRKCARRIAKPTPNRTRPNQTGRNYSAWPTPVRAGTDTPWSRLAAIFRSRCEGSFGQVPRGSQDERWKGGMSHNTNSRARAHVPCLLRPGHGTDRTLLSYRGRWAMDPRCTSQWRRELRRSRLTCVKHGCSSTLLQMGGGARKTCHLLPLGHATLAGRLHLSYLCMFVRRRFAANILDAIAVSLIVAV